MTSPASRHAIKTEHLARGVFAGVPSDANPTRKRSNHFILTRICQFLRAFRTGLPATFPGIPLQASVTRITIASVYMREFCLRLLQVTYLHILFEKYNPLHTDPSHYYSKFQCHSQLPQQRSNSTPSFSQPEQSIHPCSSLNLSITIRRIQHFSVIPRRYDTQIIYIIDTPAMLNRLYMMKHIRGILTHTLSNRCLRSHSIFRSRNIGLRDLTMRNQQVNRLHGCPLNS